MKINWSKANPRHWVELSSPLTLGIAGVSLFALILGGITRGASTRAVFSVYRSSWADPLSYLRVVLHIFGHGDFAHYAANMGMVLVLGPLVEKHYGSRRFLIMVAVTALVTGLTHILLSPGTAALGASGIVFMLIFLSAISGRENGKIPLTLILVAVIYLGREVAGGLFTRDSISQLAHVMGAVCGVGFGLVFHRH
jgi:membrane associated rhomboid family serine protease